MPKRIGSWVWKRDLSTHAHNSTFQNTQKVGTTQLPNRWMNRLKKKKVYPCNEILLSPKKKGSSTTWYNMELMLDGINQMQKDRYCVIPPP